MALTMAQIALMDIISDRIITYIGTMKTIPGMDPAQVAAETKKYEDLSDSEMDELNTH